MSVTRLTLTQAQRAQMIAHVRQQAPEEACGILAGQAGRVHSVHPVENIRHSPVAYEMDPMQQLQVMEALEAAGLDIVGIFHSHPAGPPAASPTDLEQAYYPEAVYVILAPQGGGDWGLRGFLLADGRAEEVKLTVAQ
ncbi:MAG: M67 family metallopeptidase [Anaerolineales bacterium]|nr:M67 family metallopeptidase [Anaerolineales bacterium]